MIDPGPCMALVIRAIAAGLLAPATAAAGETVHLSAAATPSDTPVTAAKSSRNPAPERAQALFSEVAGEAGLDFVHFNGMSGEFYFPEMVGAGAALLDYDNDGDLDIYLVQGHMLGAAKNPEDAMFPPAPGETFTDRLYRNDLAVEPTGTRRLRFTDVTEKSGIDARGYGMGVASADFDNDGWADLYVTNFGSNQLLRNNGDGTFSDVTAKAGVDDPRW